jgi:hypothetical protein
MFCKHNHAGTGVENATYLIPENVFKAVQQLHIRQRK